MEALEALRSRIPGYAGYAGHDARYLVDQQVRAWVGEHLARLAATLRLAVSDSSGRYDRLIRACEFADPEAMRALEGRALDAAALDRLYRADLSVVEAAERADAVDAASAGAYMADVERLLTERTAILAGASEPPPTPS